MKRLRLVKVLVQPVFVLDDGETLTEITGQAGTVSAAEWPSYATERFLKQVSEAEVALNPAGDDRSGDPAD